MHLTWLKNMKTLAFCTILSVDRGHVLLVQAYVGIAVVDFLTLIINRKSVSVINYFIFLKK